MADPKMSLDRIIAIISVIIAIGGATFSVLHNQNQLEYLTKSDFNTFQVENVKKMTTFEGKLDSGFLLVSNQISSLQFVSQKDLQEFKDKYSASTFDVQKQIDFLKRDLESLQKDSDGQSAMIQDLKGRILLLENQKRNMEK